MSSNYHKWSKIEKDFVANLRKEDKLSILEMAMLISKHFKWNCSVGKLGGLLKRMGYYGGQYKTEDFSTQDLSEVPVPEEPRTVEELHEDSRVMSLKGHNRIITAENVALKGMVGQLEAIRELIVTTTPTLMKPPMVFKGRSSKKEYPAFIILGDWHIGEVINNEECGGWGDYNYDVACARVALLGDKLVSWLESCRAGWNVTSLRIVCLGDFVAGNIHKELETTNEWPTPVAAVRSGDLLARFIAGLAPHAKDIVVDFTGVDNHGRLTVKPQYKKGAENNWNMVVSAVAQARTSNLKNVTMNYHKANPATIQVDNSTFIAMHGHQIKGWSGMPSYGMQRWRGREALVHMQQGKKFDLILCGHFHEPTHPPGWFVNGCLTGTTELDHALGRMAPPQQMSFLWNDEIRAPFNINHWRLVPY